MICWSSTPFFNEIKALESSEEQVAQIIEETSDWKTSIMHH
jgi:hypothetical protein